MTTDTLLKVLASRSAKSIAAGGDGYISTATLIFDVGRSTRAVRRILDTALASGAVERRSGGDGRPYSYKATEVTCS